LEPLRDRADLPAAAAELIRTGTERERIFALLGLREAAHRGQEVAEPAMLALTDPVPKVRIVAARALGVIGWTGARPALEAATDDDDTEVRTHALLGLLELDVTFGLQRLTAMLHDADRGDDGNILGVVFAVLEAAKFEELPPAVGALTCHPDAEVRRRAVAIMGYAIPAEVEPLYRALNDPSTEVRLAAIEALIRWQHPAPAGALAALLSDPDRRVWRLTLSLVVRVRGPRHPESLDFLPSTSPEDVAEAAAVLGGRDAIPRIRAMLDRSTSERGAVASWRAAGLVGETAPDAAGTSFIGPLRDALRAGTERVRLAAMRAASYLGPDVGVVIIEHMPGESDSRVRAAAVRALSNVLGPEACPQLRLAMNDPSEGVRCSAMEALGRVGAGDDRKVIEQARPPATPMEALMRWQALVRLTPKAEATLPEATRQLADPAHVGRLFTQWHTPIEHLSAVFSRVGAVIVYREDEVESSTFAMENDDKVRIGEKIYSICIDRVRIHDPATSMWGYRVQLIPDPWSHLPMRVLETMSWATGGESRLRPGPELGGESHQDRA
jgi:HEAT repeat protein